MPAQYSSDHSQGQSGWGSIVRAMDDRRLASSARGMLSAGRYMMGIVAR